jgi:aminoglycoside phosphotransferase family enzyme
MTETEINDLAQAGTYEGRLINGNVEETHISYVILTPHYAFKIKKQLKLSFLDFSSLALRKFYCERELELNRRFTDIYLTVQPITKSNGRWVIGSQGGDIIDYCVIMKRLSSDMRMDILLRTERIDPERIRSLARSVAHFHENAVKVFTPFDRQVAKDTFNDIVSVREFIYSSIGSYFSDIISGSVSWGNEFVDSHAHRFQQRIDEGFQRDVHGDLHAGNIFLYPDPVIFDCIEFNDQFRHIDVLYEVAYLCMDLETSHHKKMADVFFSEYSKQFDSVRSSEDELLFNYYKALRANVRAKVHAIGARDENNPEDALRHLNDVERYLDQLNHYIVKTETLRQGN